MPRTRKLWTPDDIQFLIDNYADNWNEDLALALQCTISAINGKASNLKLKKDPEFIRLQGKVNSQHPKSVASRFKPGCTPINKGKPMPDALRQKIAHTWFARGHLPHNTRYDGALKKRKDGYWYIRISLGYWRQLHTHTWEQANRPIDPVTEMVKFKDGNRDNCALDNLYLSNRSENMLHNTIHNYPVEVKQLIRTLSKFNKVIKKRIQQHEE